MYYIKAILLIFIFFFTSSYRKCVSNISEHKEYQSDTKPSTCPCALQQTTTEPVHDHPQ